MKIAHTEASLGFGGQELRILNEAGGLKKRGHELTLICPEEAEIYRIAKSRGLDVVALPIGKKSREGVTALRNWIKLHQPDVINTHSSTDSWLVALATLFMKNRPAVVRTRHISAPVANNSASRWLYTRSCDHVVTTGEKLRETFINENGYPPFHITSVRTGIDLFRFKPGNKLDARRELELNENDVIIGIVATLRSWKGHSYLIDAFATVPYDANLKLLIIGDGPQDLVLRQKAVELGLNERVLFAGRQDNVEKWMQAMDIFCLPSYANEGVPQSLMQSQACGIPAITTLVGSIDEAIIPEQTALIVPPKDVSSLADALKVLISDDNKRIQMGLAAARQAADNFSEKIMLDKMEAIFTRVTQ
ncbi:MAG: glycosyltransferase [Gammaproteobacteria bacterium]